MRRAIALLSAWTLAPCLNVACQHPSEGHTEPGASTEPDTAAAESGVLERPASRCALRNYGWIELNSGPIGDAGIEARRDPLPKITVVDDGGFEIGPALSLPNPPEDRRMFYVMVKNTRSSLQCWINWRPAEARDADGESRSLSATRIDDIGLSVMGSTRQVPERYLPTPTCLDEEEQGFLPIPWPSDIVEVRITLESKSTDLSPPPHCIALRSYQYSDGKLSIELDNAGDLAVPHERHGVEYFALNERGELTAQGLALTSSGPLEPGASATAEATLTSPEATRLLARYLY